MMKALIGDTVVDDERDIGIVESRERNLLVIRYPVLGNQRIQKLRDQVKLLAERIRQARAEGRPLQVGPKISLTGDSRLADLVGLFGYSTGQLRRDSLEKVVRQLQRAGLEIATQSGNWARDDRFRINLQGDVTAEELAEESGEVAVVPGGQPTTSIELPDPFWPTVLGLERNRELDFLRALTASDPILCLLYMTDHASSPSWIHATWEGLLGWAFHAAQKFARRQGYDGPGCEVRLGPETLLGAIPEALGPRFGVDPPLGHAPLAQPDHDQASLRAADTTPPSRGRVARTNLRVQTRVYPWRGSVGRHASDLRLPVAHRRERSGDDGRYHAAEDVELGPGRTPAVDDDAYHAVRGCAGGQLDQQV